MIGIMFPAQLETKFPGISDDLSKIGIAWLNDAYPADEYDRASFRQFYSNPNGFAIDLSRKMNTVYPGRQKLEVKAILRRYKAKMADTYNIAYCIATLAAHKAI